MIDFTPQQAFDLASNIVNGDNPPFTCSDFRALMPAFTTDIINDEQLQHFIDMANAVVKEARWLSLWKEGMRLYIAHFVTLFIEAPPQGATRQQLINAGRLQGNKTNKNVGQVSVGYDNGSQATADLEGWAAWKLTTYGVQFATYARMIGKGGMFIR